MLTQVQTANAEKNSFQEESEQLKNQNGLYKGQVDDANKRLQDREARNEELNVRLGKSSDTEMSLQKTNADLVNQIDAIKTELHNRDDKLNRLQTELANQKAELIDQTKLNNHGAIQISAQSKLIEHLETSKHGLEQHLEARNLQCEATEKQSEQQLAAEAEKSAHAKSLVDKMSADVEKLTAAKELCSQLLSDKQRQHDEFMSTTEHASERQIRDRQQVEASNTTLNKELSNMHDKVQGLEQDQEHSQAEIRELKREKVQLQLLNQNLTARHNVTETQESLRKSGGQGRGILRKSIQFEEPTKITQADRAACAASSKCDATTQEQQDQLETVRAADEAEVEVAARASEAARTEAAVAQAECCKPKISSRGKTISCAAGSVSTTKPNQTQNMVPVQRVKPTRMTSQARGRVFKKSRMQPDVMKQTRNLAVAQTKLKNTSRPKIKAKKPTNMRKFGGANSAHHSDDDMFSQDNVFDFE